MQRMLAQRQAVATSASISAAVEGYHAFLRQMRLRPIGLEPSALVDLVWHTHQQHPVRYVLPSLSISLSARIVERLPSLSISPAQYAGPRLCMPLGLFSLCLIPGFGGGGAAGTRRTASRSWGTRSTTTTTYSSLQCTARGGYHCTTTRRSHD